MSTGQKQDRTRVISRRVVAAALPVLLAGCAATGYFAPTEPKEALLTPTQAIALPPPAQLGRKVEARQLVTVTAQGKALAFEARVSATSRRFHLVGVDTLGRRAVTIDWDGKALQITLAPWIPEGLPASSLMADIAVIYWPEAAARAAVAKASGEMEVKGRQRTIRIGGKDTLIAEHDWAPGSAWNGTLRYKNLAWGTEVEVQSQELK